MVYTHSGSFVFSFSYGKRLHYLGITMEICVIAGDVLEQAVLAAVRQADDASLDRNFDQLLPYYTDVRERLPRSQQEPLLQGLHLLALLVQNRIAEFHTALERLAPEVISTPEVAQVCDFEAWLMEGAYNKVMTARNSPASPYYIPLLERLASTVQDELASCSEAAYASLPTEYAVRVLRLNNDRELEAFAENRGWKIEGDRVHLTHDKEDKITAVRGISSTEENGEIRNGHAAGIIEHCMNYTKELERIV